MKRLNADAYMAVEKRGMSDGRIVLHEDAFVSMLYLERRRAERAQKRFVLMLVDVKKVMADGQKNRNLRKDYWLDPQRNARDRHRWVVSGR